MSEHSNAALHRKAHEVFIKGDMDSVTKMIADDAVFHSPGKSLISGEFRSRDAVFSQFFAKMDELSGGTGKIAEQQDYLGNDERSVALFRYDATRSGKSEQFGVCEVIRWRGGQIVEEWTYLDDQDQWDTFWS